MGKGMLACALLMTIGFFIACCGSMGTATEYSGMVIDVEVREVKKDALIGHSVREGRLLTLKTDEGNIFVLIEVCRSDTIVVGKKYNIYYDRAWGVRYAKRAF